MFRHPYAIREEPTSYLKYCIMRTYWQVLIPALLFLSTSARAQRDLTGSPQHSHCVYVYRIDDREALKLYRTEMEGPVEPFLHTLVDSLVTTEKQEKHLPPGNYLWVQAQENKLHVELRTEGDLRYDLLNDGQGLTLSLRTKNGDLVRDARVHIGHRYVPYDAASHSYRLPHRHKGGNVQVEYKGVLSYFTLDGRQGGYHYRGRLWYRVSNAWPLRYIFRPIRRWAYLHRSRHDVYAYEHKFVSFLVFSKPKYKPGDTVKGKAFIEDWKGRPIDKPLLLRIRGYYDDVDTVLALIRPYRPGGFEFSFLLSDSLKLHLDKQYEISLEDPNMKDKEARDESLRPGWSMARGTFWYEEYELSSIRLLARVDREENSPGNPVALYLRGTDENDMTLPDARVNIHVLASGPVNRWEAGHVFLPDTLWKKDQPLDPVGETKILLPDSIFPAASFSYSIHCDMLNSSNELKTASFSQTYSPDTARIAWHIRADSLYMDRKVFNRSIPTRALLYAFDSEDDTLGIYHLSLPGGVRIDPYCKNYEVTTLPDSTWDIFEPGEDKDENGMRADGGLFCSYARTRDSIHVAVQNPMHIPFWYAIYFGNNAVWKGYGDSLVYRGPTHSPKNYFVNLKYIWGGKLENRNYTVSYRDKILHLHIQKPAVAYPGQEATITIGVRDAEGMPVADADLTAYAFTRKFKDAGLPRLPYLGKTYPGRKQTANFRPGERPETVFTSLLDWQRWHSVMGLDTSEYYRFLHPSPLYINREPSPVGLTEIAPFVHTRLGIYPADLLYIDEVPVFFNQADLVRRYSFPVYLGVHSLRIRIAGRQVKLDSIRLEKGMKTFVSIDSDEPGRHVSVFKMPDSLTREEQALWSDYMIRVENNFDGKLVTLRQDGRWYMPDDRTSRPYWADRTSYLAGPFLEQPVTMHIGGELDQDFQPEGNYQFRIEKGLIREKEVAGGRLFDSHLGRKEVRINLRDHALTQHEIDSLWTDYQDRRSASQDLFDNGQLPEGYKGRLEVALYRPGKAPAHFIRKDFLFRCDNPSVMRIYKGASRQLGALEPGYYRLLFLLKGDDYLVADSLLVRPGGLNYYLLDSLPVHKRDSFSIRISNTVKTLEQPQMVVTGSKELEEVLKSVNDRWSDAGLHGRVSGKVTDNKGTPIRGATVMVKGLRTGTVTDGYGRFSLAAPEKGTLVVAYIGYVSQELAIHPGDEYAIRLKPSESRLDEVVVVGYGTVTKRSLTGSVSTLSADNLLEGRVAGLSIRGESTLSSQPEPLVIIDGVPSSQQLSQLDASLIETVQVLKSDAATKMYGAAAAGGVIIVTTRQAATAAAVGQYQPPAGLSLRRDFRDEAFWQPRLTTDKQGQASFTARLPDDITNWNVYAIAMTDHKQTGFTEDSIRAFKALSASLAVPNFAISHDSLEVIGKLMNYLPDTAVVERNLLVDDHSVAKDLLSFRNAHIDHFSLEAKEMPTDSMILEYSLQKRGGYTDGERRTIPVYPIGVKETVGSFLPLDGADTSLTLSFFPDNSPVTVYAESSLLPILLDEIEHIRDYEYLCNEQLASKLLALLEQRKIDSILKKPFAGDKNIYEVISRLLKTRRPDGLWGWWNDDEPRLWISLHVTEALLMAEKAGYTRMPDKQHLIDYLTYTLESDRATDRITRIRILQAMDAKVDYRSLIDTAEKELKQTALRMHSTLSLYEQLELLTLRQTAGLPIDVTPILSRQKLTAFGNRYWGEENRQFFDNAFINTILVYRLLKQTRRYDGLLRKIRGYFLEKRKDGHWKNTYESSLVLETILPDVLSEDPEHHPARLTLGDRAPVTTFPYKGEWPATTPMKVHKTGSLPVYFTAWQQYWNEKPAAVNGVFEVKTHFEKDGKTQDHLHAGEPVLLQADVHVQANADYVMIEIPIPAGCSYEGKTQEYGSEVHREYFKNKVSVFCTSLKAGHYTYAVRLMPRWSGVYHLNPARAEMMYFPVFYGREALREVKITEESLQNR